MKIAHNGTNIIAFHNGFDDISHLYPNLTILTAPDDTVISEDENGRWLIPAIPDDDAWDCIRKDRDILLAKCDWTQMPDSPLSSENKSSWATYRQSLRDIPENYINPDDVVWPTEPA